MTKPFIALVGPTDEYTSDGYNRRDLFPAVLTISSEDSKVPEAEMLIKNEGVRPSELEGRRIFIHEQGRLLFDGVIETAPVGLIDDMYTIIARARPLDEDVLLGQLTTLGNSLKVAPYWDPLLVPQGKEDDWAEILAARPSVVVHSRVRGEPSIASAVGGASTLVVKPRKPSIRFNDPEKVKARYGVKLTAAWKQLVLQQFRKDLRSGDGISAFPKLRTLTPDGIVEGWPQKGTAIGDGFVVSASSCDFVRGPFNSKAPAESVPVRIALTDEELDPFIRKNGLGTMTFDAYDIEASVTIDYRWEAERSETAEFSFPVVAQSGMIAEGDDIEEITLRPLTDSTSQRPWQPNTAYDVDDEVVDGRQVYRCRIAHTSGATRTNAEWVLVGVSNYLAARQLATFFRTSRGRAALSHALERAKARATFASRAVEVQFDAGMPKPWFITHDMELILDVGPAPNKLPGGFIRGRLISYTLTWDRGTRSFSGTIASCVGAPGPSNEPVLGTPTGSAISADGRVDITVQNDWDEQKAVIEGAMVETPEGDNEVGSVDVLETIVTISTTPAAATSFEQTVNVPISGSLTFPYQAPIEV
jgi:hypothetical protein